MEAVGMTRIARQDAPVEPFGIVQPPGLMMLEGVGESRLPDPGCSHRPAPFWVRAAIFGLHI
jgi:hypothetical protein